MVRVTSLCIWETCLETDGIDSMCKVEIGNIGKGWEFTIDDMNSVWKCEIPRS